MTEGCKEVERENKEIKIENKEVDKEEWKRKAKILLEMKEGDTLKTTDPMFTKPKIKKKLKSDDNLLIDLSDYENYVEESNFEYSNYWKKEAYKATKQFITNEINQKPNCKVTHQGYYRSHLIRYIGNRTFSVKFYCEFDCN